MIYKAKDCFICLWSSVSPVQLYLFSLKAQSCDLQIIRSKVVRLLSTRVAECTITSFRKQKQEAQVSDKMDKNPKISLV